MKRLAFLAAVAALCAAGAQAFAGPAATEACSYGGVPGLSRVAQRLAVKASEESRTALNACDGRSYEIGALLNAAIDRIDRAEARIKKLEDKDGERQR